MVYDVRKEIDMARLDRRTSTTLSGAAADQSNARLGSEASSSQTPRKTKAKPWANLWKEKRLNNSDMLLAAEEGSLQAMLDLLDPAKKQLQVADVNTKGADQWNALHFAVNEGHGDIA